MGPGGVKERDRIRRLWGNTHWTNRTGFKTVFVLGIPPSENTTANLIQSEKTTPNFINSRVRWESEQHRDIIQLDFEDTYYNLTLKTLCGLHWVRNYCRSATWVLKSDADVVVNIFELTKFLHHYDLDHNNTRTKLLCRVAPSNVVCRGCRFVKWRVSHQEYPRKRYPPYCYGPGYIIPRNLVDPLYEAAITNLTHLFKLEDIYFTGMIPQSLGWKKHIQNIGRRFPWRPHTWMDSFALGDLMILELDRTMGHGASALVWSNILKHQGLVNIDNHTYTGT
ncbi:hypothetical protein Pcinc_015743 [Petrolisthes cinctipes]|uniref:Hexosyltransferase n=1 Tax=Petrolisthes cinctipes TaxID=88211 RepID=A0AAE1FTN7_PETCI|nr:hypothetical protein Pcinc_015743 [Petrolisthes cinctipes]